MTYAGTRERSRFHASIYCDLHREKETCADLSARLGEKRLALASIPTTDLKAVTRKEVFQPHLPVRLPCYDLAPITSIALGRASTATDFRRPRLSWLDGRCVQGPGTYSPRHG